MKTILMALAAGIVMFGAIAVAGGHYADAKGKPGAQVAPATITLDQADPHLGDWVTFTTAGATLKSPRVQVMCYASGTVVYGEAGPADQSFLLGGGSSLWKTIGGSADCVATFYEWDFHPVQTFVPYAATNFSAGSWR